MNKIICGLIFFLFFSCSMQEDELRCEGRNGYLYKDGMEFTCPFTLQERTADKIWIDYYGPVIILDSSVDDFYPLRLRNSSSEYGLSMKVPKEFFAEEQYVISISAFEHTKKCGESKEFVFHRVEENVDTYKYSNDGKRLFFGLREMPSYDWYHVLNIGNCEGKSFTLKGEIVR